MEGIQLALSEIWLNRVYSEVTVEEIGVSPVECSIARVPMSVSKKLIVRRSSLIHESRSVPTYLVGCMVAVDTPLACTTIRSRQEKLSKVMLRANIPGIKNIVGWVNCAKSQRRAFLCLC